MVAQRVVVAMSGGVDSSVAAALLSEEGYEVIGVGLRLHDGPKTLPHMPACCGVSGMEDARAVAARIGIPFYVLDCRRAFTREIIDPFCKAYARGETPNPCVTCNARLKFGFLLDMALTLDADYVATGHYARLEHKPGSQRPMLRRGLDPAHDQSYFLYSLSSRQLTHALFPLGALRKSQVRETARHFGLAVAEKASSQDICFVGKGGYREFLARHHPSALSSGPITDMSGRVLGRHKGIGAYTVGQRRYLGIAAGDPLYAIRLDAATNTVVVGARRQTYCQTLKVERMNWLGCDPSTAPTKVSVKTRYRGPEDAASILPDTGHVSVRFSEPRPIVARGQAAVFYLGDLVVGGGTVRSCT